MIESLFVFPSTRGRHLEAPLLKEREEYLLHLQSQGRNRKHLRLTAAMLLNSLKYLNMVHARPVDQFEVTDASARWAAGAESHQGNRGKKNSAYNFSRTTTQWLRFHGLLVEAQKAELLFDTLVNSYPD
jgi:integrase/recombinase XerD